MNKATGSPGESAPSQNPQASTGHSASAEGAATPESVKALIKATPHLATGAFYLGMPADAAVAALKSSGLTLSANGTDPLDYHFRIRQVPNVVYRGGAFGRKPSANGGDGGENVGLAFTMYPNPPVVSAISRGLSYPEGQGPTVSTMLAALRKKYGPESYADPRKGALNWVFDAQGQRASSQLVKLYRDSSNYCALGFNNDSQARKVAEGMDSTYFSHETLPGCRDVIVLTAAFAYNVPGNGGLISESLTSFDPVANGIISTMSIAISDYELDIQAAKVSHDLAVRGLDAQTQQQIDQAKKRKVTDL